MITFNTQSAAQAASDFMLMMGDLLDAQAPIDYLRVRPRERKMEPVTPLPILGLPGCGIPSTARRARGDGDELPLPER